MAVIGGAQSAFDKIFGAGRVFYDPRLMPRWDVLTSELFLYSNGAPNNPAVATFHDEIARHGASVLVRNTTSYVTIVDLSGGAGVMSFAYGPWPDDGDAQAWGTVITWKFTIDGTVTEVPVYPKRRYYGTEYRACLGGPMRTDETIKNRNVLTASGAPADSGTLSHHSSYAQFAIPLPTQALSGAGGPTPLLGWTDAFKVEVKSSVATLDVAWTQNQSGVVYQAL